MSEDEKEAIKTVEYLKTMKWYSHAFDNGTEILTQEEKSDIDIVLNLIEKQQKELQQEKEKNKNLIKQLQEQNTEIQDISKQLREKEQEDIKMRAKFVLSLDEYILKDKIREILERYRYTDIGDNAIIISFYKEIQELLVED